MTSLSTQSHHLFLEKIFVSGSKDGEKSSKIMTNISRIKVYFIFCKLTFNFFEIGTELMPRAPNIGGNDAGCKRFWFNIAK